MSADVDIDTLRAKVLLLLVSLLDYIDVLTHSSSIDMPYNSQYYVLNAPV